MANHLPNGLALQLAYRLQKVGKLVGEITFQSFPTKQGLHHPQKTIPTICEGQPAAKDP